MVRKAFINIERIRDNGIQTLGQGTAINGAESIEFVTLEPSWILNNNYVSCIPVDRYDCEKRNSAKFDEHFHIKDVPGRSYILIHSGNYRDDTQGCIIVGEHFQRIDKNLQLDVVNSRNTLDELLDFMPERFQTFVVNHHEFQSAFSEPLNWWEQGL